MLHCTYCNVHGTYCMVHCVWCMVHITWGIVHTAQCMVHGIFLYLWRLVLCMVDLLWTNLSVAKKGACWTSSVSALDKDLYYSHFRGSFNFYKPTKFMVCFRCSIMGLLIAAFWLLQPQVIISCTESIKKFQLVKWTQLFW